MRSIQKEVQKPHFAGDFFLVKKFKLLDLVINFLNCCHFKRVKYHMFLLIGTQKVTNLHKTRTLKNHKQNPKKTLLEDSYYQTNDIQFEIKT